jgi:hypothetical protein
MFALGVVLLTIGLGILVHLGRDWAADRKREQQFADEWVRVHRARHDHSDDRRSE